MEARHPPHTNPEVLKPLKQNYPKLHPTNRYPSLKLSACHLPLLHTFTRQIFNHRFLHAPPVFTTLPPSYPAALRLPPALAADFHLKQNFTVNGNPPVSITPLQQKINSRSCRIRPTPIIHGLLSNLLSHHRPRPFPPPQSLHRCHNSILSPLLAPSPFDTSARQTPPPRRRHGTLAGGACA